MNFSGGYLNSKTSFKKFYGLFFVIVLRVFFVLFPSRTLGARISVSVQYQSLYSALLAAVGFGLRLTGKNPTTTQEKKKLVLMITFILKAVCANARRSLKITTTATRTFYASMSPLTEYKTGYCRCALHVMRCVTSAMRTNFLCRKQTQQKLLTSFVCNSPFYKSNKEEMGQTHNPPSTFRRPS